MVRGSSVLVLHGETVALLIIGVDRRQIIVLPPMAARVLLGHVREFVSLWDDLCSYTD